MSNAAQRSPAERGERERQVDPSLMDAFEVGQTVRETLEMLGSETPPEHPAGQGRIELAVSEHLGRRSRRAA